MFLQTHVFVNEENEETDEIEELHLRRNYLGCLCKLVVYNVIPMKTAADIFKHYVAFYNEYGEIIRIGNTCNNHLVTANYSRGYN